MVIASPAASEAPMGVLLSRFVDGNILVLEAGRTRAPVAAELRDSLSASGGAVVGAVLTRYRSHRAALPASLAVANSCMSSLSNNIYPPIMAGGAELIVAWLSEGLAARGHRSPWSPPAGRRWSRIRSRSRNGVTVIRFFPRNVYWNFAREGSKRHRRDALASARCLEPRCRQAVPAILERSAARMSCTPI